MSIFYFGLHPTWSQNSCPYHRFNKIFHQYSTDSQVFKLLIKRKEFTFYLLNFLVLDENLFVHVVACFFLYQPLIKIETINGPVWFVGWDIEDGLDKFFGFTFFLYKNNDLMNDIGEDISEDTLCFCFFLFVFDDFFIRPNFPVGFLTVALWLFFKLFLLFFFQKLILVFELIGNIELIEGFSFDLLFGWGRIDKMEWRAIDQIKGIIGIERGQRCLVMVRVRKLL